MAKQTKTLKQENQTNLIISNSMISDSVIIKQRANALVIERKHLPELIELLKSELEGSNNG